MLRSWPFLLLLLFLCVFFFFLFLLTPNVTDIEKNSSVQHVFVVLFKATEEIEVKDREGF